MYTEIDSSDAKAKLSKLLREVTLGRRFTLTLGGQPIADLIPTEHTRTDHHAAVDRMRAMKKVKGVDAETIQKWLGEERQ
jgi:antitoxin (DNA-binding transcriptional repressor) of toxin-antitoxin stability system